VSIGVIEQRHGIDLAHAHLIELPAKIAAVIDDGVGAHRAHPAAALLS
jgi:hypothetical protein